MSLFTAALSRLFLFISSLKPRCMKKWFPVWLIACCAIAPAVQAQESRSLPINAAAPLQDTRLMDVSGKEVTLKQAMQANGLLVMFSCNTCPYVKKNQQRTRDICRYALENRVGVILLNANEAQRGQGDSYEAMQQYAREQQYQWYYAVDKNGDLAAAFGASRTPEVYLFNKDGRLVYKGAIDDNPGNASGVQQQHLKTAIDLSLAGKDIPVKETRSVGCAIKRN